jgi:hypothetical protein
LVKSKFIKENDILIEKPEFLKRINVLKYFFIHINSDIIQGETENTREFFINNTKTLFNCKISLPNENVCKNITEDYFYFPNRENINFSYKCESRKNELREPILSSDFFEITSIQNNEIELNILFDNTTLSEWYKNY